MYSLAIAACSSLDSSRGRAAFIALAVQALRRFSAASAAFHNAAASASPPSGYQLPKTFISSRLLVAAWDRYVIPVRLSSYDARLIYAARCTDD